MIESMDKLREIYDKAAKEPRHASDGDFDDNLMDFDDFQQAIADYEASKWVSVDERLPEFNKNVLGLSKRGRIDITFVDGSGQLDVYPLEETWVGTDDGDEWIAWQYLPLPTPPTK